MGGERTYAGHGLTWPVLIVQTSYASHAMGPAVKARDIFGALVRAMDVYFACNAVGDGMLLILKYFSIETGSQYPVATDWIGMIWRFCVAITLLFGANLIVRLAYGGPSITNGGGQ